MLQKVMGAPAGPEFGRRVRSNPVPRRLAATDKARQLLGFSATVSLEEGLQGLVEWWQQQQRLAVDQA